MASADDFIAEGWIVVIDRFTLRRLRVAEHQAKDLAYHVVEGGQVREDGLVPVKIQIDKPRRLRGVQADALLVPPPEIDAGDDETSSKVG